MKNAAVSPRAVVAVSTNVFACRSSASLQGHGTVVGRVVAAGITMLPGDLVGTCALSTTNTACAGHTGSVKLCVHRTDAAAVKYAAVPSSVHVTRRGGTTGCVSTCFTLLWNLRTRTTHILWKTSPQPSTAEYGKCTRPTRCGKLPSTTTLQRSCSGAKAACAALSARTETRRFNS